jgi:hypothetical protein
MISLKYRKIDCREGLKKSTKNRNQYWQFPGRNFNLKIAESYADMDLEVGVGGPFHDINQTFV